VEEKLLTEEMAAAGITAANDPPGRIRIIEPTPGSGTVTFLATKRDIEERGLR